MQVLGLGMVEFTFPRERGHVVSAVRFVIVMDYYALLLRLSLVAVMSFIMLW